MALIAALAQPHRVRALALYEPTLFAVVDAETPPPNEADGIRETVAQAAVALDAYPPMSHQRPVISTTKGAEGIDVGPGENIMIGDTPEAFAASCVELIGNRARRHDIAQRGRRLIEEKYSDKIIADAVMRVV